MSNTHIVKKDETKRTFTEAEAKLIIDEVASYMLPVGRLSITLGSWWGASQKWARNRASLTANQREVTLAIYRPMYNGAPESGQTIVAATNQVDSASLHGIAKHIDFYWTRWKAKAPPDGVITRPPLEGEGADVWDDKTFNRSITENANAVERLTRVSENDQLMSSGYIETIGSTALKYRRDEWGRIEWEWGRVTQAQCSATVRHPSGSSSSWAGKSSFDISRVNIDQIAQRALERCKLALNPVRIEPGRYQAILEPQAVATMTDLFMRVLGRYNADRLGSGPMFLGADRSINRLRSKLGLKVMDERISIFHDPTDPVVGSHVAPLHRKVELVKNGVLTGLMDSYSDHLHETSDMYPVFETTSYTVSGGDRSIEDMISSSRRALLVTRLTQPELVDQASSLYSGVTRDGLWLIENGKITKSVRNFRWTESPLFIMNNIEEIGRAEQVFNPNSSRHPLGDHSFALSLNNVVVPPLKVNDFSFTSTIDAV